MNSYPPPADEVLHVPMNALARPAFRGFHGLGLSPSSKSQTGRDRRVSCRTGTLSKPARSGNTRAEVSDDSSGTCRLCNRGRRHLVGAIGSSFLSCGSSSANAGESQSSYSVDVINKFHPCKPAWYEEFYASQMDQVMQSYEADIADYKAELFGHMNGEDKNVLEFGIGTGSNLKFYAKSAGVTVFGVDPNKRMEKYAQAASIAAGLPLTQFKFIQAVAEALPVRDESMDIVIGTLVLCSVKDVRLALKEVKRVLKPNGRYLFIEHVAADDGTPLRFIQGLLDPLQQLVVDGCHLTRETGKELASVGFSDLNMYKTTISKLSVISPHVLGVAVK